MLECTVSELNKELSGLIDDKINKNIQVKCEIMEMNISRGNVWLKMRDDFTSLQCVFWNYPDFPHNDGDKVKISGSLKFFVKRGSILFIGRKIELIDNGKGNMFKQLEKNYKYLEVNGYFNNANAPMPDNIRNIGVLTAKTGDAIKDFEFVLKSEDFKGKIYVYNCNVQGTNCPKSVIEGIKFFSSGAIDIDVLLLTRGGGSMEDLMGFSDMNVIKELYNCSIYTVSAIGHQNDNMLTDYVANHRSPTPSVAGRDICKHYCQTKTDITELEESLERMMKEDIATVSMHLYKLSVKKDGLPDIKSTIEWEISSLQSEDKFCYDLISSDIDNETDKLRVLKSKYQENTYDSILEKGYCLLLTENGKIVKTKEKLEKNKNLKLYMNGIQLNVSISILE